MATRGRMVVPVFADPNVETRSRGLPGSFAAKQERHPKPRRRRKSAAVFLFGLGIVLSPSSLSAQLARVGGQFQINTSQVHESYFVKVAGLPDGGFMVVWDSQGRDADGAAVLARRFGADGTAPDPEFLVNTTVKGDQESPDLAVSPDGRALVVWNSPRRVILAQFFESEGAPIGPEFEITAPEFPYAQNPVPAALPNGSFVIVWADGTLIDDGRFLLRSRLIDPEGEIGPMFQLNDAEPAFAQVAPSVASLSGDSFVVAWFEEDTYNEIRGRRFDGRKPLAPAFTTALLQGTVGPGPDVCVDPNGTYTLVWAGYTPFEPFTHAASYRRYDSAGNAITRPTRVTPDLNENRTETDPSIECFEEDHFVIVWSRVRHEGLAGRNFTGSASTGFEIDMPDGIELGPGPSIARLSNGDFVVVWGECTFDESTFERDCNFIGQRFMFTGPVECPGDCNDDGDVTVDELVLAVRGALVPDVDAIRRCLAADTNLDYRIGLPELVRAVARSIDGCDAARTGG